MKIDHNGTVRDMTAEEMAELTENNTEPELTAEEALQIIMGVVL